MPVTLANLLDTTQGNDILLPRSIPYVWNNGDHTIPMTKANIPLIGMAYVHHDVEPRSLTDAEISALETAVVEGTATADGQVALEKALIMRDVVGNLVKLKNCYIILVACHQVKELKQSNLENFAKMCRAPELPQKALSYIAYWAGSQDSFAASEEVRHRFESNRFFEYHTMSSSTPSLCVEALEEASELGMFSDEEINSIEDASGNSYDIEVARRIGLSTIVKCSAILEASGRLPDNWWMGKKAVARYSAKRYVAMVKHLKKIFELQMNTDNLDTLDLAGITRSLRTLLTYSDPEVAPAVPLVVPVDPVLPPAPRGAAEDPDD